MWKKTPTPAGGLHQFPGAGCYYGYPTSLYMASHKYGAFLKQKINQDGLMHVQCIYDLFTCTYQNPRCYKAVCVIYVACIINECFV